MVVFAGCSDGPASGGESTGDATSGAASESSATTPSTASTNDASTGNTTSTSGSTTDVAESSDASSSGTTGPEGSEGCGLAVETPGAQWVGDMLDVDGTTRLFWLWLPDPYDPNRPYPVVYQFHGCSAGEDRQNNNPPVEAQSGADAIHVRGQAIGDCWDLTPQGADVLFFDALVAEIESTLCADPARRFVTGYSSGAFMTHRLACDRGDALRGVASIAGGVGGGDECQGSVAALLIHDLDDQTVAISASEGARDTHVARNGCDAAAPTTAVDPPPCEAYAGCTDGYPVVWCQTAGQDHSRQDELAAPAFWNFLSALGSE